MERKIGEWYQPKYYRLFLPKINFFQPYKPAKIDVFLAKVFPRDISDTTFLGLVTVFALVMSCRGRMKR